MTARQTISVRGAAILVAFTMSAAGLCSAAASKPNGSAMTVVWTFARDGGAEGTWLESRDSNGVRHVLTSIPSARTQRGDAQATISPDGTKVAFVREGRAGGHVLYVVNSDGSDLHVVAGPGQVGRGIDQVMWAPGGDALLFGREAALDLSGGRWGCNRHPAQLEMYVVSADGTGLRQLRPPGISPSSEHPENLWLQGWSPDGQRILYAVVRWNDGECVNWGAHGDSAAVYTVGRDGSQPAELLRANVPFFNVFSPSGDLLARSSLDAECNLAVRGATATGTRVFKTHSIYGCNDGGGLSFGWLPSGDGVVFSDGLHIGVLNIHTGATRTVRRRRPLPTDCRARNNAGVCEEEVAAISPDGADAAVIEDPSGSQGGPRLLRVALATGAATPISVPAASSEPTRPPRYVVDVEVVFH
jgi:hypothetical protein